MVLWVMTTSSWVDTHQCFAGNYSVFIKGKNRKLLRPFKFQGVITQETSALVVALSVFRGLYTGKRLIWNHARSNTDNYTVTCMCDCRRGVD
jgi:hypothetical protein